MGDFFLEITLVVILLKETTRGKETTGDFSAVITEESPGAKLQHWGRGALVNAGASDEGGGLIRSGLVRVGGRA